MEFVTRFSHTLIATRQVHSLIHLRRDRPQQHRVVLKLAAGANSPTVLPFGSLHYPMAVAVDDKARSLHEHVLAGAAENLATGDGVALNHRCDLFEGEIERVAQDEHDALDRGEPLQNRHQGERHVFGAHAGFILGPERFGQPFADIGFSARTLVAQAVETEPRCDRREIGLQRTHRFFRRGIVQAHECVLHNFLGIGPVADDAVGEREHLGAQLSEGAIERHAVETECANFTRCIASFAWCHDTRRRPGQKKKPGILRSSLRI